MSLVPLEKEELSAEKKIEQIADRFEEIMEILGLDLASESLKDTPQRVAKMFVNEVFSGLQEENFPALTFFPASETHSEGQVILVKTDFASFCEHHFIPFIGKATVAYIPNKKVLGLSKISRIVHYFAKKPQVQERLTAQVLNYLSDSLDTKDIAISITAQHLCMVARGVEERQSFATTQILKGKFKNCSDYRQQFLLSL